MWQSSWTATDAGQRSAACRERRGIARERRRSIAIVTAAARKGVDVLTLYAFSQANWQRPLPEVRGLFGLFRRYLKEQTSRCVEQSIRLNVIGRRDRPRPSAALAHPGRRARHGALRPNDSANRGRLLGAMELDAGVSLSSACPLPPSTSASRVSSRRSITPCRSATWILLIRTRRRTTHERLPAVGVRVRGAAFRYAAVAGLRRGGFRGGARRVLAPGSTLWRPSTRRSRCGFSTVDRECRAA